MKIKKIRKIMRMFEQSSIGQFEITHKKTKIKMQKPINPASFSETENSSDPPASDLKTQWIHSPLVGTFYIKMTRESAPLISIGQPVKKNDILCIIETMKVFNEIKSPVNGRITKISVEDGQMVEYHQPMIEVSCND